jgi:hypothetical protein
MSDTLALGILNTVQVLFLGYLTYRQRIIARNVDGHLHEHMDHGEPQ